MKSGLVSFAVYSEMVAIRIQGKIRERQYFGTLVRWGILKDKQRDIRFWEWLWSVDIYSQLVIYVTMQWDIIK